MIERFEGPSGHRLLLEVIKKAKLVEGDIDLAQLIIDSGKLELCKAGSFLIKEGDTDNSLCWILTGELAVLVKGNKVGHRSTGDVVGEAGAINPTETRMASLRAEKDTVVLRTQEADFSEICAKYPIIWKNMAIELSKRLAQRNALVSRVNDKIAVFIICSKEALEIAREVQLFLSHADMLVTLWTDGVFKASNYPLESLEAALDAADFAIAIAQPDDKLTIRSQRKKVPRDNVIFELGYFMGYLGRKRTILMEPRNDKTKLPSDLSGLTTIGYKTGTPDQFSMLLAPACTELQKLILNVGIKL